MFLLLVCPAIVLADEGEPSSLVGKMVMHKLDCQFFNGSVPLTYNSLLLTVEAEQDGWLLVDKKKPIWAKRADLLTFDEAEKYFDGLIRAKPTDANLYWRRAVACDLSKQYDKAIADCNEAIRLQPTTYHFHNSRGIVWENKKEYSRAIESYNEAFRLSAGSRPWHTSRGYLLMRHEKNYSAALADFDACVQNAPFEHSNYTARSEAYFGLKDYEKALADAEHAIQLSPKSADACRARARVFAYRNDWAGCLGDYEAARTLDPQSSSSHNLLAWLLAVCPDENIRDGARAVELADRAARISKWKDAGVLGTLAAAYAEVGDFEKAVKWQEKSIELRTHDKDNPGHQARLTSYQAGKPWRIWLDE